MTLEEALLNIKTHFGWADRVMNGEVGRLFLASVDRLVRNTIEYRQHDLRKNPKDLPPAGAYVLVWFEGGGIPDAIFVGGTTWVAHINPRFGEHPIIAWRYIEPFEEVEV